jgi:hypothetical protein
MIDWRSYKTMPKNERVLVCYLNIYGYNHVTEGYWHEDEEYPTAVSGAMLSGPFLWAEMPKGPSPDEIVEILKVKAAL